MCTHSPENKRDPELHEKQVKGGDSARLRPAWNVTSSSRIPSTEKTRACWNEPRGGPQNGATLHPPIRWGWSNSLELFSLEKVAGKTYCNKVSIKKRDFKKRLFNKAFVTGQEAEVLT